MPAGRPPNRRDVLRALAAASVAAGLRRFSARAETPTMLTRPIPSSREPLPVVGLGTYDVFNVGASEADRKPIAAVLRAFDEAGARVVDSSPMYDRAESVLGEVAAKLGVRERLFVATKVWTEGRESGIAQMNESFRRLGGKTIDLMQIHNLVDWKTHLATLREWKAAGRIRYIGITHYRDDAHAALEAVLTAETVDFVQLNYSIASRAAERRLLPLAAERGVAVLVNRPFRDGDLFAKMRGKPLPAWAADAGCASWAQIFLKYVLAHPAVTCAIPATNKVEHLLDNLGAGRAPLPDAALRARMVAAIEG